MIGVYIFYNLVYALATFPLGIVADKVGMKRVFVVGLLLFATVYAGMSIATTWPVFAALFFLYGLYAAATEGGAKAWMTNICENKDMATAIGTYTAFQSIGALLASSLAGLIWYAVGPSAVFTLSACMAVIITVYMARTFR